VPLAQVRAHPGTMRRADCGGARTAGGCRRHNPIGLHPRPGPKPRRDFELLKRGA
jgi:hypothetical protein